MQIRQLILIAIFAIGAAAAAVAAEFVDRIELELPASMEGPSEEEFLLAAKRTFYRRGVDYRVISGTVVEGIYKDYEKYRYEIRHLDGAVSIVWTGTDREEKKVDQHLRRFERDLKYELGRYLL